MRIKQLEYHNTQRNWQLLPIEFSDLTLLVGISGVGKTQILKAIQTLVAVSNGKNRPGTKWKISFVADDDRECVWSGEYETVDDLTILPEQMEFFVPADERQLKRARLIEELLVVAGQVVVERKGEHITFNGARVPKLSPHESVLFLLKQEDEIQPLQKSFSRIISSDQSQVEGFTRVFAVMGAKRLASKYLDLESIKQSTQAGLAKLFLAHHINDPVFGEVRGKFISVFPNVEDLSFSSVQEPDGLHVFGDIAFVTLKERGVPEDIHQSNISSGMLRTLSHLADLYLSPPGTVILIDEFENSLGVNCIDAVTEDLLVASSSIQFIITSHHPYIINNVSVGYWKVVRREGSQVSAVDAEDLGIGISSHDAFLQLMNAEQYLAGVTPLPAG